MPRSRKTPSPVNRSEVPEGQVLSNRIRRVERHQYLFFNNQWRDAGSLDAP